MRRLSSTQSALFASADSIATGSTSGEPCPHNLRLVPKWVPRLESFQEWHKVRWGTPSCLQPAQIRLETSALAAIAERQPSVAVAEWSRGPPSHIARTAPEARLSCHLQSTSAALRGCIRRMSVGSQQILPDRATHVLPVLIPTLRSLQIFVWQRT